MWLNRNSGYFNWTFFCDYTYGRYCNLSYIVGLWKTNPLTIEHQSLFRWQIWYDMNKIKHFKWSLNFNFRIKCTSSVRKVPGLPLYLRAAVFEQPLRGMNVNSKASQTYRLLVDICRTYSSCAACLCLQSYFWVRRILWLWFSFWPTFDNKNIG